MSAFTEPPCEHDPTVADEYDCGCIYCHECEDLVERCANIPREPDQRSDPVWCHYAVRDDDKLDDEIPPISFTRRPY